MAERTKGMLEARQPVLTSQEDEIGIIGDNEVLAEVFGRNTKNGQRTLPLQANSAHIVACWNAIEAVGGDPAIVAETLMLLTRMLAMHGDGCRCVVCADTRVVLRKAGRLS